MVNEGERGNALLTTLSPVTWDRFTRRGRQVDLTPGQRLIKMGERYETVFFPTSGVVSLTFTYQSGIVAELATVGREGVVRASAMMDGGTALCDHVVQIPGAGWALSHHDFKELQQECPAFRNILLSYSHAFLAHVLYSVGCNSVHRIRQRAARWLLMCDDRTDDHTFDVTHEFLAAMLGVSRESVNQVARDLREAGRIRYSYGHVTIDDRAGLEDDACECYWLIREAYENALSSEVGQSLWSPSAGSATGKNPNSQEC